MLRQISLKRGLAFAILAGALAFAVQASAKDACWDTNQDHFCGPGEDLNGDGVCNAYDCTGGFCWDGNGNGQCDIPAEDGNGDGVCDLSDCGL